MIHVGIMASGRGSNFQSIIDAVISGFISARIVLLVTDNPQAYALRRAERHRIESLIITPEDFADVNAYYRYIADEFEKRGTELIILAGFMRVVRKPLIERFPNRIMNIHPALLPSFPGLHGQKQAAEYGVKISGCTVHFVDEGMDTGPIIIQAAVPSFADDTEESLSKRILKQEHRILPYTIKLFAEGRLKIEGRKVTVNADIEDTVMINPPLRID